jgi:hypothetical protein
MFDKDFFDGYADFILKTVLWVVLPDSTIAAQTLARHA